MNCGDNATLAVKVIACRWADHTVVGGVGYVEGAATSFPGAASKTIRARSVIEH